MNALKGCDASFDCHGDESSGDERERYGEGDVVKLSQYIT